MENGKRIMGLSDIDSTVRNLSQNTIDSRNAAKKSLNNFISVLENFKTSEAQNSETENLISEYGGKNFDSIFEKTSATGEEQKKEFTLKLSLIINYIKNCEKHMRV